MDPFVLIAVLAALYFLWRLYQVDSRVCVQCGGRGKHRRDCPFKKDEE